MDAELQHDSETYETAGWRKMLLCLGILLPLGAIGGFTLAGAALARDGIWIAALVFAGLALFFVPLLLFMAIMTVSTFRLRIRLADDAMHYTLPTWRGPTPMPPYATGRLAYGDIAAVEQREEIYRALGFPGHVLVCRVVPKTGRPFLLGYVNIHGNQLPAISFADIAARVAARAGVEVRSRGTVDAGGQFRAMLRGGSKWNGETLSEQAAQESRVRTARIWKIATAAILILIAINVAVRTLD